MTRESPIGPSREELVGLIQMLSVENAALKARIAELERSARVEQLEQFQAALERWFEEAGAGHEPARAFG